MLLRNYDNIMTAFRMPHIYNSSGLDFSTDTETFGNGHINIKCAFGKNIKSFPYGFSKLVPPFTAFYGGANQVINTPPSGGQSNLICGSNDKPVTYDDYTFDNLISGLTYVSHLEKEPMYDESTGTWTGEYNKVFTNSNAEPITVREIAVNYYTTTSSGVSTYALVYRKVLDEPIEVPAGANFILSFKTIVSANPNIPTNYDASASVE